MFSQGLFPNTSATDAVSRSWDELAKHRQLCNSKRLQVLVNVLCGSQFQLGRKA